MLITRPPRPALRPFIELIWADDGASPAPYVRPVHECVLPTGAMHLVFRMNDCPLHIHASPRDRLGERLGGSSVGGARSRFYVRQLSAPSHSVGVVLRPGAADVLLGASAAELAEQHIPLGDLWGSRAQSVREQLLEAGSAHARLAVLESVLTALTARTSRGSSVAPAVAYITAALPHLNLVSVAVNRSGLSHRHFIAQFRREVGLTPKTYLRLLRFQRALSALRSGRTLALLAAEAGYSDQAHFQRDFLEFAGVTPVTYLRIAPREANHLPLPIQTAERA